MNDSLLSNVINFLRFPLIIGVVFIHNVSLYNVDTINFDNLPLYFIVSNLFSQVIGRISVPLFFFISGILFFYNVDFNLHSYRIKLKKRIRTLLIPYLFWNILSLLFYYIISYIPILSSLVNRKIEYDLNYILSAMWGITREGDVFAYPIAYQFWFIRDLMVVVLLTPLIYLYVKKTKVHGVVVLCLLWFLGYSLPFIGTRGLGTSALFFFVLGAWFSINKKNTLLIFASFKGWMYLYFPIAFFDLCTKGKIYNQYIHNLGILFGIVLCFMLTAKFLESRRIFIIPFLSSASFFLFAIHDPWVLTSVKKMLFLSIQPKSDFVLSVLYFLIVLFVVLIALGIYYLMKHYLPRFTRLITGGR